MSDADWDRVDDEWQSDDAPEEVVTEAQLRAKEYEERQDQVPDLASMAPDAAVAAARHAKAAAGPTMLIATLRPLTGGRTRSKKEVGDLATEWMTLLFSGNIEATVYDVGEGSRLLVTLQRGWYGEDVREWLLGRDEVTEVEWDGHTYRRGDGEHEAQRSTRKRSTKAARRKKGKKSGARRKRGPRPKSEL